MQTPPQSLLTESGFRCERQTWIEAAAAAPRLMIVTAAFAELAAACANLRVPSAAAAAAAGIETTRADFATDVRVASRQRDHPLLRRCHGHRLPLAYYQEHFGWLRHREAVAHPQMGLF